MFTILRKTVDGRSHDDYYHDYGKAKRALHESMERTMTNIGGTITRKIDRMNSAKGFYEYQVDATLSTGDKCTWALIDGHFLD